MKKDFLSPEIEEIRHQISQIIESYNHEWDILAELAQNSMDAIRVAGVPKGHISVVVDSSQARISFSDNGAGFPHADLPRLLRPFGTNKKHQAKTVGVKGVGLKFVIFSSNSFRILSWDGTLHNDVSIPNAKGWLASESDDALQLEIGSATRDEVGTTIEIKLDQDHPIFALTTAQLLYVLRTRTALGDTGWVFDESVQADFTLRHVDKAGTEAVSGSECRFLLPTEYAHKNDVVDLEEYEQWRIETDPSDAGKRTKLNGRIVKTSGSEYVGGRQIRYWACSTPKRETWKLLSKHGGLLDQDEIDDDAFADIDVRFRGEIQTATKGMPTGISLPPKSGGSAGYLPNFYIIVDDPYLSFDIGRKSINARQQGMIKDLAARVFRKYVTLRKFMGSEIQPYAPGFDKDELFSEIEDLPDLNIAVTRFRKRPNGQEAMVAALFYEMLGKGQFPEISPLISGYRERYDLYALWGKKKISVEFKYDVAGLLSDFSDAVKMLNEIDCLIVWEVTERDRILLSKQGTQYNEISDSGIVEYKGFPRSSGYLYVENVTPTYVVEIKRILEKKAV
jgi:hypothetical protein